MLAALTGRHGKCEGRPEIPVDDAVGLAWVHHGPMLVALSEGNGGKLPFIHVSDTSNALVLAEPRAAGAAFSEFFAAVELAGRPGFRVRCWQHRAVARIIHVAQASGLHNCASGHQHSSRARS